MHVTFVAITFTTVARYY